MKSYLKMETHPLANPENVIKGDKYRITVLTEHLLRLEYSEDGEFIDAASQTVVNRDFRQQNLLSKIQAMSLSCAQSICS